MEANWTLPETLSLDAKKYFQESALQKAVNLIQKGKVNLSFSKGDLQGYLILSGLVREDRAHECKIVYKKRLEGTHESPLSSNCDCIHWTPEHHCQHTASLYLTALLKEKEDFSPADENPLYPPINLSTNFSVSVETYGTLINNPHSLLDAPANSTYSSLQYLLKTKKIVDFPVPEPLNGKIKMALNSADSAAHPLYSWLPEVGEEVPEISLFENLYLFDWSEGRVFHLPSELKALIQKIRLNFYRFQLDDYLRLVLTPELRDKIHVTIDGVALDDLPVVSPLPRVTLNPSEKKGYIDFHLVFQDANQILLPMSDFLANLTFGKGLLSLFKKKKDGYDFLFDVVTSFRDGHDAYKKKLIGMRERQKLMEITESFLKLSTSTHYDPQNRCLVTFDHSMLGEILATMLRLFGENFYRYASYDPAEQELRFLMTSNSLFMGLTEFNQILTPYGLTLYYDRQELSKWTSRIRFERKQSATRWFDLELELTKDDLEIIKQADLEQGLALTDKGLILLTKEQKDLIRFMKRYTQHEGQAVEMEEGATDQLQRFVLPFQKARIFELFELKKLGIEGALTTEEEALCHRLATLEEIPNYPVPERLAGIMRPYQITGYNWLNFLYENRLGACLADDMGLGKTLQTIAFLQSIEPHVERVLIVCPVTILLNWESEFKKFSDLKIQIYHGGSRDLNGLKQDSKIIITSYGVMKKEAETTFGEMKFNVMILDEVQHLKNIRSLGAYAARKINADFRICLTGTPVENDLAEFYNILDLSIPGIWGDLQFIRTSSTSKSRLLARKTASPFILRRTKAQVLTDLPEKIENTVSLSFSDDEREFYLRSLIQTKNRISSSPTRNKYGEILKGLLELRQSCLWQRLSPQLPLHPQNSRSTKIEFLVDMLDQIQEEGHQTIVFSQFTTYLDLIQETLEKKHWNLSRIDGSQSIKKRQEQVDRFQDGKSQIFLISLKAGGVGLNLTAASYVFIMDPWWNPAVESQAIDRAHRIGQKNKLTVYRPIIKDSVEEKVLQLQELKKQLFYDLLPEDDDKYFSGKLSLVDFQDLLGIEAPPEEAE